MPGGKKSKQKDPPKKVQKPKEMKSGSSLGNWIGDRYVSLKRSVKKSGFLGKEAQQKAMAKEEERKAALAEIMQKNVGQSGFLALDEDPTRKAPEQQSTPPEQESKLSKVKKVGGDTLDALTGDEAGHVLDLGSIGEGGLELGGIEVPILSSGLGYFNALKSTKEFVEGIKDDSSEEAKHDRRFMSKGRKVENVVRHGHRATSMFSNLVGTIPGADPVSDVLEIGDAGMGMFESGMKFGNSTYDRSKIKAAKKNVQGTRKKNMLNFGQSRAEHDMRDAAADFTKNTITAGTTIGAMVASGGTGGKIGKVVGAGLNKGIDAINAGVQHHYDAKAERKQIDQEIQALNEERPEGQAAFKNYAGMKNDAYSGVNSLRAKQAASGKKATRYTKKEIKEALSMQVAGVGGGREGINKAVLVKYVRDLSDPEKIEENKPILEALGFNLDKAKKSIDKENTKRSKKGLKPITASPLPSEGAIAKALGWRGKDEELQEMLAGTIGNVPKGLPAVPAQGA